MCGLWWTKLALGQVVTYSTFVSHIMRFEALVAVNIIVYVMRFEAVIAVNIYVLRFGAPVAVNIIVYVI
jgi:hypothetical protein